MRHKYSLIHVLLVTLVVVFGSASARAQEACPPNFIPPPVDSQKPINSQDPINVGWLKAQLKLYYRCGYARDLDAALGEAKRYIEQRMSETPKPKNPAIVLDIDDTALSNWNVLWQDDLAYFSDGPCEMKPNTGCGWHAWELMAQASAIAPTLDLFNAARAMNVEVFFITGRAEAPDERAATIENLTKVGYSGWNDLFMKTAIPSCDIKDVTCFKTETRAGLVSRGYTIIANIGDQWSDLDPIDGDQHKGTNADRIFKVPNPFYAIPCKRNYVCGQPPYASPVAPELWLGPE